MDELGETSLGYREASFGFIEKYNHEVAKTPFGSFKIRSSVHLKIRSLALLQREKEDL